MAAIDRLHGKGGRIKMNPLGVTGVGSVEVASLNKYDLDLSTEKVKVTCFGDTNHVYVQGLPDIKFTYGGVYDPADGLVIFDMITGTVAPWVDLIPNIAAPTVLFGGNAYIDGKISVDASGAITIGGSGVAAGPWVLPSAA